jgi:hypothetical protein
VFSSGCAAPNLAGVGSPITALLTTASDAAALDQELADEFLKQSAVLYFLSNRKETCLDNDGLTPTYVKNKQIQRQEEEILKLRLVDLYNLADYADSLAKIEKDRVQRAAQIDTAAKIVGTGTQMAGYFPLVAAEAAAVKQGSDSVAALVKLIDEQRTTAEILRKAREMQPKVDKMITRLKERFHIVSDRTQLYVNAWRACTREKYIYIRDRMASQATPVSVVDLDNSYSEFREKYRAYLNRIPHIDKASFEKIREANNAMVNATDIADFQAGAEKLAAVVNQLVSTYKTLKSTGQTLSGA